jgi:hypothetical protein
MTVGTAQSGTKMLEQLSQGQEMLGQLSLEQEMFLQRAHTSTEVH